ncbi:two-component response regulator-like APRR7 [Lycium ferocissimum]|uniref:two-component response regulator-like APRR7 n=1 Tax=Lycium ferocissimum TaxID=112874 RepID=UPI0028154FF7|nr:two-component response regulator-like APRR7 [Lycium ferocissimum]
MTTKGDGDKELPDEDEVTGNKVLVHEGKNVVKNCEFKVEIVNGDVQGGAPGGVGALRVKGSELQQQEQSQGAVICWERFLHVTSIKVLLVENDDSTRHVVTALLRNCKYEVIQAANGLQAWKILENHTNQIDLVLSEVVMPCLSGIGLLCKIMSHKTHKNIPVIMMSPHDSVGLVFKCLSKGATDFLVKPIRKNELKNLWQHVWRRCQSSSGSGNGSGTQTQKSVKSKSGEQSDNNSGSNEGEDNQENAPLGNGSDDASDTQSSWTKQAVEVDSSQAMTPCNQALSPCNQAPECGDNIRAQVIRSNAETSPHRKAHMNPSRDCQEEPDNTGKGKPSITDSLRDQELEPVNAIELPVKHLGAIHKSALEIDSNAINLKMDIKKENRIDNHLLSEQHLVTAEVSHPQIDKRELNKVVDASEINIISTDDSKHNVVELSLKRLRGLRESGIAFQDDRNVLRQSELSAFSRYNSSANLRRTPNGISRSSSLIGNSLEIAKNNSVDDIEAHTDKTLLNPSSKGASNNIATGPTTNLLTSKSLPLRDTVYSLNGPHFASSNIRAGSCEGNPEFQSLNRSASGNNHGCNVQNGSSKAVNAGGANGNSDTELAGTSRSGGDASGSGSGNTMDPFKLVRAAALTKFRQKRKERCFEKKVRYQNRKKLAEQRPRVRGQFVRQIPQNNSTNTADG